MTAQTTPEAVLEEARAWIGTPYVHQQSAKGFGCDCLGLVRGVWRALLGDEPEAAPPYSPDWAEARGEETLLEAARRHLVPVDLEEARPGDVLLYRMGAGAPVKHAAILSRGSLKGGHMIHAYSGHAVAETSLLRQQPAAVFRFP